MKLQDQPNRTAQAQLGYASFPTQHPGWPVREIEIGMVNVQKPSVKTLTLYTFLTNAAAALSEESWGSPTMRVRSGWPERDFV